MPEADSSAVLQSKSPTPLSPPSIISTTDGPATIPIPRRGLLKSALAIPSSHEWPSVRSYEILSVIGVGGMGIVYKALHHGLRRTVALKMLRGAALADPEYRERFSAEAQAVARLQHPNIIQVFEIGAIEPRFGEIERSPFIALEYVDGGSLVRIADKPQPPHEAAAMIEKLALAVQSAHQLGVVHRDLKPANVLLTNDGEPKIADFGLAKQMSPERDSSERFVTQAGMVVGTPEYMAPEQATGAALSPAMDIYSLGVILYELLTARVPFQAASPMETIALARTEEPISPRRFQPSIPRDLETICLKCLRKEPARRYGSAQALADDLQRFRNGRSIQARRATGIERMWRWCRRNPIVAASLMGVVVTFMVAFLLVSRSYWRAEAARAEEARQRQESERREMAERRERYRANLIAVASALQDHDAVTAGRLLDGMPEEYRNWEGRHFYSRLDAAKEVVARSDMPISSVLVIANGRRAVMYGPEHDVDVWDTVAGKRVGHFSSVSELDSARISPDGQMLAYVPNQTEAFVIDVASGQVNTRVGGRGRAISYFRFSADSTRLTTISVDQTVSIWNPMTGELLKSQRPKHSRAIAIELSPCFQRALYKTTEGKLYCWDLETENEVELPHAYPRGWHSFWFSPKGDRVLAVEDYRSNTIHLWDAATGRLIRTMSGHDNELTTHAFSPDGTRLATGSRDKTVQLWDVRSGERLAVLRGHRGWVSDVKFSPDGSRLVSGALDHNIHIWDAISGTQLAVLHGHTADVASVMYSADGTEIVSAARDGTVRRWDAHTVESGGVLRGHASYVYRVAFHPDGELVASASWDGTARLWNATTGRQTASLPHGDEKVVTSVDFHPGGRLLATRARDAVRLWDVVTGAEVHCWRSPISSWRDTRAMFSPDGALIAAGCEKGVIRIWNVSNRSEVAALRGHRDDVRDLAFSPDGRWLASAGEIADKTVRIWDLATMKSMQVLDGHTNTVYTVAFSSDGKWLASGSTDGTVRLYDTATWRLISVLTHGPNVYGVAFTKDNTRLACACADNSIRFWDTETLQEVAVLRGHSDYVHAIAFSPDGSRLASASGDFTVRIWDTLRSAQRVRSGR